MFELPVELPAGRLDGGRGGRRAAPRAISSRGAWRLAILLCCLSGCGRFKDDAQGLADAHADRQRGEYKAAIIEVKNVLQRVPSNGAARLLLGQLYLETGDPVSAEKELRRAQALRLPTSDVLPPLAEALLLQGRYEQVLTLLPDDAAQPRNQALRGNALLGLHRIDDARAQFEQALARQPSDSAALQGLARIAQRELHPDAALALVDRALAAHPDDADGQRLRGDLLRLQGQPDAALLAYRRAAQLRPQQVLARTEIVAIHLQTGKLADAKSELAAARKIAPNSLPVVYQQALIDFHEKKLAAAQEQLQLVLRAAPEYQPALLLAGSVELALGALPQAEQHLRKYLELYPGHAYASRLLASVAIGNDNPNEALRLLAPYLDASKDPEALAVAGEAWMRLKQYGKAADMYQRATALSPQAPMLHSALGLSRLELGDTASAIAELEQASAMDAASPRSGMLLVLAHLRNREHAAALAAVRAMEQRLGANNPLICNLKGGVLLASGDKAGARLSFERALALDPVNQAALDNLTQLDLYDRQPERARLRLAGALAAHPGRTELMISLARLATVQNQAGVAGAWLERAAAVNPDALQPALLLATHYLQQGEQRKALAAAQKLQASYPDRPDVLTLLARTYSQGDDFEAALDSWTRLSTLQPQQPAPHLQIATVQLALGQNDAAMRSLTHALALQPDFPQAQVALAALLSRQQAYPQAIALARTMQRQHPEAPLGLKVEGDVMMAQRQPEAAQRLYQRGYELRPSGELLMALHDALRLGGRAAQARARLLSWLAQHPRDQAVRMHLAGGLLAERDYPAARTQFNAAVQQDPGNIIALNNLAWICQQLKDPRARAIAQQAYRRAPRNAAVLDTLAWIMAEQGDSAGALPLLTQASTLAPAAMEIRYHLGVVLARSGNKRDARTQFQQLLANKDFGRRDEVKAMMAQL